MGFGAKPRNFHPSLHTFGVEAWMDPEYYKINNFDRGTLYVPYIFINILKDRVIYGILMIDLIKG